MHYKIPFIDMSTLIIGLHDLNEFRVIEQVLAIVYSLFLTKSKFVINIFSRISFSIKQPKRRYGTKMDHSFGTGVDSPGKSLSTLKPLGIFTNVFQSEVFALLSATNI